MPRTAASIVLLIALVFAAVASAAPAHAGGRSARVRSIKPKGRAVPSKIHKRGTRKTTGGKARVTDTIVWRPPAKRGKRSDAKPAAKTPARRSGGRPADPRPVKARFRR